METHLLTYRHSQVHYYRYGQGKKYMFCFHGYGEDGESFKIFEGLMGDLFTLIAIDFPFHGKTVWEDGLLFEPTDLITIINLIKPADQSMHLLGYSMGGRVALQLLQVIPELINKLVLVAPDGLHKNKWQWLSTETRIGNRLFAYCMHQPVGLLRLIDKAAKLGLFKKNLLKFIHYYLDDAEQRAILYRRWTTMRKFRPDTALLKKIILLRQTRICLLFGEYDRVILSKHGFTFSRQTSGLVQVTEIEAGHQLLREKYAPLIAEMIRG